MGFVTEIEDEIKVVCLTAKITRGSPRENHFFSYIVANRQTYGKAGDRYVYLCGVARAGQRPTITLSG